MAISSTNPPHKEHPLARIDDIRRRLEGWARWVSERESGGVGYPRRVSWLRVGSGRAGPPGSHGSTANDDAMLIDRAVHALVASHQLLGDTVMLHYAKGYDVKRVASKMGRAESTVRRNLELADVKIQAWLIEQAEHANRNKIAT